MKRIFLFKALLLILVGFPFVSCEVEPLKGEFPQENPNDAEVGQFVAKIEGQEFIADSVYAFLSENGSLTISGTKTINWQIILTVGNGMEGSFDLTANENSQNSAIYTDGTINAMPYSSLGSIGGNGRMNISQLDMLNNTVSGTFSFKGVRIKLGNDGLPVLDGGGNEIVEEIQISSGAFNTIPVRIDTSGGGGDPDPDHEFFAKVNNVDFIAKSIRVRDSIIADVHMFKIEAVSALGEKITIDIPRSLGLGTFSMEPLSDGTKLIGIYKKGSGSANLTSNPGTINITEFNLIEGVLKADFSFRAKDPFGIDPTIVEISEGSFTLNFEGIPGAIPTFKARVDGIDYTPDDFTSTTSVFNQYPRVTISAVVNNQKLEISFPTTSLAGNYEFASEIIIGNEVLGIYVPQVGTSISYISHGGSLIITDYDLETGIIQGSFNFTAKDASGQDPSVYQITAGDFLIIL